MIDLGRSGFITGGNKTKLKFTRIYIYIYVIYTLESHQIKKVASSVLGWTNSMGNFLPASTYFFSRYSGILYSGRVKKHPCLSQLETLKSPPGVKMKATGAELS